jgi:hypothetical protein|tara:strand:+ start:506 stop:685 length:180 start_codon:yes stop_codon:yes gene_type:complete
MRDQFGNFLTDQFDAISIDWDALTASIVILATGFGISISKDAIVAGNELQAKVGSCVTE